ncbi:unnamed protein product [Polarella glacialis]|uniref:Uncharacterized protein n=1 Tax=Polarella glacialis TaxID=89957 RepID=A0A813EJA1_POLGL|nr:unnamed protein product [Polarella glacialis]
MGCGGSASAYKKGPRDAKDEVSIRLAPHAKLVESAVRPEQLPPPVAPGGLQSDRSDCDCPQGSMESSDSCGPAINNLKQESERGDNVSQPRARPAMKKSMSFAVPADAHIRDALCESLRLRKKYKFPTDVQFLSELLGFA